MRVFEDVQAWERFLDSAGMLGERVRQIATEGALLGSVLYHGIAPDLVIISDDAGQFKILLHALCWVHAERTLDKIVRTELEPRFDTLFTPQPPSESLNNALQRIHRNKAELLLVLTRPEIPLHNN